MASYTENYALTKPTMAESADIRVINNNMDTVDDVMHSTQISLAPAYDLNETYNTGDVVMYELLMYECLEDEVTGAWDATKWQRTTAGEHGGGSDVEVTQIQTEGKAVASIAVDGVSTDILIPELKVYGEATGDLITIEDAMEAPLEECQVTLEPQQDLNGYEYPWVGGAGKNLADFVQDKGINNDGIVVDHVGRIATVEPIIIENGVNYVYKKFATIDIRGILAVYNGNTLVRRTAGIIDGAQLDVSDGDRFYFCVYYGSESLTIDNAKAMIVKSTDTVTAYEPYSNICPISGWTECKLPRAGVNIWDEEWEVGTFVNANGTKYPSTTKIRSKNPISVKPNTTYYYYVGSTSADEDRIWCYDADMNFIRSFAYNHQTTIMTTFTTPANCAYINISIKNTTYNHDISINYPSTDTEYHAYNGLTYTIQLGDTYYGGELDVVNGVLRVDRESVDMGTLNYTYLSGNQYFQTTITDKAFGIENIISSHYSIDTSSVATMRDWTMKGNTSNSLMYFKNQAYNDATAFKTAMDGVQLVYELATPQEIQLTPTEVTLLLGINNLWSDGEMYIKYRRDIEMLLQRIADSLGGNA